MPGATAGILKAAFRIPVPRRCILGTMRVLVVDDDVRLAALLRQGLRAEGCGSAARAGTSP